MAFIEQTGWTLYLPYPSISYSVSDTMISMPSGSVLEVKKLRQTRMNLEFRA